MKAVPPEVAALAPEGTEWFGGPVDRIKMSLRVHGIPSEHEEISALLGCRPDRSRGAWGIEAEEQVDGNFNAQLQLLLGRVTSDLNRWKSITDRWKIDVFCGLFLERPNRGVELSVESLGMLRDRGICLGFDIYAPGE